MNQFKTHILLSIFLLIFTIAKGEIRIDVVHCICGPSSPGGVTIIATGTAGPFTFQWSGPEGYESTLQSPTDISVPGLYEVAVTNAYGCAVTLSTAVGECPVIDPLILSPTPTCTGASNGVITIAAISTGTAPYAYAWSTGATTDFINNLAPGEYCLTVTDANGCTAEACATITSEQALDMDAQITNVCGEDHNGSIVLAVSGGSGEYEYDWNTDDLDGTVENLAPGIYKVTVTDEDACGITGSFEIIANTPPVIASAQITVATCASAGDGAIALTVNGGTSPYSYAWNHGATTASIQNLDGTEYCVTVTDANSCEVMACYTTLPSTSQDAAPYVKRVRMFAVPLSGGSGILIYDGEWVTTAAGCVFFTGGTLEISQPLMTAIALGQRKLRVEAETSEAMEELQIGGHFFTLSNMQLQSPTLGTITIPENAFAAAVTNNTLLEEFTFFGADLNGNPLFDLHATSQNQNLCIDIPQLQPNCSWAPVFTSNSGQIHVLERKCLQVNFDLNIEDGGIRALPTGGTGPYTYAWREEGTSTVLGTNQFLTGLSPGRYCVSVTDNAGCSVQECVTLCAPLGGLSNELLDILLPCPGGAADGSICIPPNSFHNYPVVYQWQNGSSEACIPGLSEGLDYCVTVTELVCMQSTMHCIIGLGAVGPVSVALSSSQSACPNGGTNGRLQVTASGGRAPYAYVWDNGTTGAINTGLSAGACHSVTVTDACGQTAVQCFNLPNYSAVAINGSTITPTSCVNGMNGRIQLSLSGGVTPMTFQWENTDGIVPQPIPSASLNNIGTGTYWVTITDVCGSPTFGGPFVVGTSYTAMAALGNNISDACGIAATGSINFTRTGGVAPFVFSWTGPNGFTATTTAPFINSLLSGNYAVTITDACGETLVRNFVVGATAASTSILINEADITHICASGQTGAIDLSASTSSGTLTFVWSTGATTEDVSGLTAGIHSVTISNGNCALANFFNVEEPQWELVGIVEPAYCKDENGIIDLKIEGNAGPLSFQWNTGATTEDLYDLEAGTYSVTATDAFGCSRDVSFVVGEANSDLSISLVSVQGSTGSGNPDFPIDLHTGSIDIQVTGNFPPFSFQWSNGATTEDIDHLASGTYWVTVTDQKGCKAMMPITLPVCINEDPIVTSYPWQVMPALTAAGGSIGIGISGGNPPYTYAWQGPNGFSSTALNLTGLTQPGEYCVTVTDYCNRTASICREIVTSCPTKNLYMEVDNGCLSHGNGGDITLNAISSFSNFSDYLYAEWSTGQTGLLLLEGSNHYQPVSSVIWGNQSIHVTESGFYSVVVTDDFGCQYHGEAQLSSSTFEALVALDIKLSDISSDFTGYDERVIDEFYVCSTCGYIFNGRTFELFDCVPGHHEHILFTPFISLGPNDAANPCRRGGTIQIQHGPDNTNTQSIFIPVLPNSIATFVQEDDGGCGCLFPPEVLENFPSYLYNGMFSDHSELIYTELQGVAGCSPGSGQDPFTNNTFDLGVFSYECQCAICIGLASNESACSFSVLCIDGMGNSEIIDVVVPGNVGYRKKSHLSMIALGLGIGTIHCFIYQVCETAECALPPLEIHEFPGADCETLSETDISFIAGGNLYYLSDIEFLPSCTDGFTGDPPQSFASSNTAAIKIEGNNTFSTAVYPNPATENLNIQIFSPEPTSANLQLYDIMGRKLFERTLEVDGKHIEQWDVLNTFVPGVYRLSIRDDRGNVSVHSVVLTKK